MQKIDYGDINKFLVSIGLILIGLAVLVPYLYLKEDLGLYLERSQIDKLQEPIKELITSKQNQVIKIQKFIPWISLSFLLLGLTSSIIGLVRWFKRQSKLDEKFDKEIQKLDLEIDSLTPEEKRQKAIKEVNEIEKEEQLEPEIPTTTDSRNQVYLNYMNVENNIIKVFEQYISPNFDILSQQRLGNRFEIDILLKAKTKKLSDRIVEIKYFRKQLPFSIVEKSLQQLNTYISYYKQAANKQVVPVLLLVYKKEAVSSERIVQYQSRIIDYSQKIPNLNRLKVEFIEESQIEKFNVQRILKK
ncbi:hypothetical protein UMM65_17330 [Aureibaculum sp. 2210JD6-5]|uniref:hypothetical protein n=1 Tax=Aureibaculum sp. 2210JD6-5 TaxID=3103957 RepID=UPI002AACFB58|nr:hypothetical protein [Aureibaculum sp. 2210JD6-5]MDY7397011.1 hypothetical protein [Aureibaculum sp. 2210JD6-5]